MDGLPKEKRIENKLRVTPPIKTPPKINIRNAKLRPARKSNRKLLVSDLLQTTCDEYENHPFCTGVSCDGEIPFSLIDDGELCFVFEIENRPGVSITSSFSLRIALTHPFIGDLKIFLTHVSSGKELLLWGDYPNNQCTCSLQKLDMAIFPLIFK